ncbi:unnamed protein product [Leptidea sinapis]|uniref:G-protein coupled receptors family 1 profile domain-containing protein n=1 Tax=Leptidea sinapis TaxID=189913 RepID=A0A5E4QDA9_9NEOP|nr:unnamed protein product [Leptidea sinapis]
MYCSVFVVALIGNGLVCFIVHSSPRMKTVTNYFIMNLAVGDILMTILCIPFSFVSMLVLRYWPFGMVMCKVVNYSQAVSVFVSSYTLLAISIDRYLAVMRPLKPRLGSVAAKFIVSFVWAGACATAAPIFVVSNIKRPTSWHDICEADVCLEQWEYVEQSHQYSCVLMLLQFGLPLTALVLTYTRIAHMVWGGRPPGEAQTMIRMMVTVVVVFTVCWLPLNVFIAISCLLRSNMDAIADTRPRCSGDGLPMSDLIGANRITRRGTTSTSLRSQRTSGSVQSARRTHPPVRALSVRSSFR